MGFNTQTTFVLDSITVWHKELNVDISPIEPHGFVNRYHTVIVSATVNVFSFIYCVLHNNTTSLSSGHICIYFISTESEIHAEQNGKPPSSLGVCV